MKRKVLFVFFVAIVLFTAHTVFGSEVVVKYNGNVIDCEKYGQSAMIVDNRTLVPVRAIFETLGATVEWNGETRTVYSTLGDDKVIISIGSNVLKKNDSAFWLDVPAQIINDFTMVPVRAIAQSYGVSVEWDFENSTVNLTKEALYEDDTKNVQVLDSGKCGENLTWTLYSDGLLKISGTGKSYDYCKGLFGDDATREQIEAYQAEFKGKTDLDSIAKYERGFQEGKVYDDENGQYIAPWYKYRNEQNISDDGTRILNPDGTTYMLVSDYERDNPNGWTYNRIEIEPGVTYLGNWFLYRVCGPIELVIPETVTEIGQWSIRYSPTLKSVYLPDSLVSIEKRGCSRLEVLENLRIGSGIKTVGECAFAQNSLLKALIVNSDIENTDTYVFGYNTSLEYVEFTALKNMLGVQFVDCKNLKSVVFSDDLLSIDKVSFVNRQLETFTVTYNLTDIGTSAFYGCYDLKTVYINSAVVAKNLKYSSSYGHVVAYAEHIYVRKDIKEVGKYILDNYTIKGDVGNYTLYASISDKQ